MSTETFRMTRAIPGTAHSANGPMISTSSVDLPRYSKLTTTVPKEFVHRAGVAEVMLTDWIRKDDLHFSVAAQWPRGHAFFTPSAGCHDPLISAETIRQVGSLLAHAEFDVPLDFQFVMWDLKLETHPVHMTVGGAPASLDMDVTCHDVKRRNNALAGFRYEVVVRRDGQVAATGGASFTCMPPRVYRRVRGGRVTDTVRPLPLTAPTAPQGVGRVSPMDVVLSTTPRDDRWQLRVDTRHPILFEHPVDHVPGMTLLEAARQASISLMGAPFRPVAFASEFSRYIELDEPCFIEAEIIPGDGARVLVTARQNDELAFTSVVTMEALPV
ncbi:ScbA/BarX family gamma-butyrolactone biosynthesis protein [Streptomyces sp. NPDC050400]|uniref:ScbA/BarX family gamma-butyrolactone biosynthesis protein n=1 Tax=Streptomyces sp. NPDC050400 TaxID=3365610 RepID=UPI0037B103C6